MEPGATDSTQGVIHDRPAVRRLPLRDLLRQPRGPHAGILPSRGPSVWADVVHESERTRVTRVSCAGGTVVRKEPLGPDAEHRLRHEVAILEWLRGVEGVVQLAEAP